MNKIRKGDEVILNTGKDKGKRDARHCRRHHQQGDAD